MTSTEGATRAATPASTPSDTPSETADRRQSAANQTPAPDDQPKRRHQSATAGAHTYNASSRRNVTAAAVVSDEDAPHDATHDGIDALAVSDANPDGAYGEDHNGADVDADETATVSSDGLALRLPTIQDIWRAHDVIRPHVYHTPLLPSKTIGALCGATVYLKAENLQRSGAYKIRGATYKLSRLTPDERARGVIAASAGNHAQGVAIAARALGIACTIVMPTAAPLAKVTATQGYGAQVVLFGDTYNDAYAHARALQTETGATYIHAYDDPDIIAGQGTLGLEILTDLPEVEVIVVGLGGGGLISGIATAVKALKPDVRIIGVEAAGAASMRAALDAGGIVELTAINTIADGIATKSAGAYTYAITRELVDEVVTVSDEEIISAVLLLLERCKQLVEGAGAVCVAALLSGRVDVAGKQVVAVLSGGNIDMNLVGRFIQHGLATQGRYLTLHTLLADRPGELLRLLSVIASQNVNVLDVEHHRSAPRLPIQQVEVTLTLETRDRAHCEALVALLRERAFTVTEARPIFAPSASDA
ncbi:MAG: threonine ammonia-lyase [Ktedonobacterales bacterium]